MTYYSCFSIVELFWYFTGSEQRYVCHVLLNAPQVVPRFNASAYTVLFFTTCLLEALIYGPFAVRRFGFKKAVALILGLNLLTHPIVCWFLPVLFAKQSIASYLATAEAFAPLAEGLALAFCLRDVRRGMVVALLANLLSWNLGLFLL